MLNKAILMMCLLAFPELCKPQNTSFLEKYSYPVFTITNNVVHNGTGFLYKKNNRTYIITNYHLRGMDAVEQKIEYDADTVYFKYPRKNALSFGVLRIKIDKKESGELKVFGISEDVDLFHLEIKKIPKDGSLNYINNLIDPKYFDKIPDTIIFYGYPVYSNNKKDTFESKIELFSGYYQKDFNDLNSYLRSKYNTASIPLIEQMIKFFRENYYFVSRRAQGGYSGSPAFGRFRYKNKTIYRFMGVIFGWSPVEKTWGIQPKRVNTYLKSI